MVEREEKVGLLSISVFVLGPVATNSYLVGDTETDTAVVIDPAWEGEVIVEEAKRRGWQINEIWLTHAHFDHFGGVAGVVASSSNSIPVALHPEEMPAWHNRGGAALFGFRNLDPGPEPSIELEHGMQVHVGNHTFEVRHTPGHSLGHVMFVSREEKIVFSGDLIFQGSVGRTDFPGGSSQALLESIRTEVLSLPDETRLYTGHGPATTVGEERTTNPFVTGAIPL